MSAPGCQDKVYVVVNLPIRSIPGCCPLRNVPVNWFHFQFIFFADVLNKKKLVKSVVCQTDLTWVPSDSPVQTVVSVALLSGGPGSVSTGTQASSGKSGPVSADARALRESALQSGQEFWVSWCWTQCFPQAPDFDPGGWVKVQF